MTIRDFIKLYPPTFHHSIEPLNADDWLHSITNKLRSANVAEGDKVTYATYHLEGPASIWWENYETIIPAGQIPTWEEFTEVFREHHIPQGLMDRKREELCNLSQGSMIVHQYRTDFNRLSCYAPEKISTDAKKQARFRKGLSPVLRHDLNLHEFVNFQDLVNKSFMDEYGNELYEESRKRDREFALSCGPVPRKRCVWIPFSDVSHAVSAYRTPTTIYCPLQPNLPPWNFVG